MRPGLGVPKELILFCLPLGCEAGLDEGHCHGEKWLSNARARLLADPASTGNPEMDDCMHEF